MADRYGNFPQKSNDPRRKGPKGEPKKILQPKGKLPTDRNYKGGRPVTPQNRPQPQVQKPIDPKAQKAVAQAMRSKNSVQSKRRRFRGGNYILYYILAAFVIVVVMLVLSNTVLFRCKDITVSGNSKYTAEEIAARSGLKIGDNLLHTDTSAAENNIIASFAYIDKAEVKKSFPTRFTITVTEAEKWFCVSQNGVVAAVSRGGKILEQCAADGLVTVKGYEAETLEPGKWLKSTAEGKSNIPELIFKAAEKAKLDKIDEIDMTDKFSIKITVDGRIILDMGNSENLESKLFVAAALIKNEIGKDEHVTVLLTNPEKVAVKNNPYSASNESSTVSNPPASSSGEASEPEENPGDPEEDPGDPEEDPGDPEEDPGDPEEDPGDPEEDPGDPEENPGDPETPEEDPNELE